MAKLGIDISAHQGNINLGTLKNSGVQFVIIRVGFGTKGTLDSKFKRNADLCVKLGLPFGFYWYSYALNESQAAAEAQACINAIAPYKDKYSMGVWFDMEDADGYKSRNGMPSNATLRAICHKFCSMVEDAGYYCGIYASQAWFNNQLNGPELNRFDKWIAQWPTSGGKEKGLAVDANSRTGLSMWQFTSAGKFAGYSGRLDCDYAYKDSYVNGGTPQPTPAPAAPTKSVDEIAQEVINGAWGDGDDRKNRLAAAGYDYNSVQGKVNEILSANTKPQPTLKSVAEIAQEVINGMWGNGDDRRNRLAAAGYNPDEVQAKVNEIIGTPSTTHIVKRGETLSIIAKKYKKTWQEIYNDNKSTIGPNPNKIYVGQKLIIK